MDKKPETTILEFRYKLNFSSPNEQEKSNLSNAEIEIKFHLKDDTTKVSNKFKYKSVFMNNLKCLMVSTSVLFPLPT
jgi:hypothetical protein